MTTRLILEIPDEVVEAAKLPAAEVEREFRQELTLALYQRGVLAAGTARLLAEVTWWEFESLLAEHRIPRHYTEADLKVDIAYARR